MLSLLFIVANLSSSGAQGQPGATPELRIMRNQLVAAASDLQIDKLRPMLSQYVEVVQYERGDDRLFSKEFFNEKSTMPLFENVRTERYVAHVAGFESAKLDHESKSILMKFLTLVKETPQHQLFFGSAVSIGHVPSLRCNGISGRVASNVEWLVEAAQATNGKLVISRIIVGVH